MRGFKLALLSFRDRTKMNLALLLQISIVLMMINILIGSMNSRSMLSDPYSDALGSKGWFVSYDYFDSNDRVGAMDRFLSSIEGDPEIIKLGQISFYSEQYGKNVGIYVLSDTAFEKLSLPTTSSRAFADHRLLAFTGGTNIRCGDRTSFITSSGAHVENAVITDILTDPTYIPDFDQWQLDADIMMLYKSVSSEQYDSIYMITDFSGAAKMGLTENDYSLQSGAIVYYPNGIDDETYNRVNKRIMGGIECAATDLGDLNAAVQKALREDRNKYMPLAALALLVMLIGTAGAIAVQALDEMKNYAVYYICGSKWHKLVQINLFKVLLLVMGALVINGAAMVILQTNSIAAKLGLAFGRTNFYASVLITIITVISSIVIPVILFRKNEPVEVMRRMKND